MNYFSVKRINDAERSNLYGNSLTVIILNNPKLLYLASYFLKRWLYHEWRQE